MAQARARPSLEQVTLDMTTRPCLLQGSGLLVTLEKREARGGRGLWRPLGAERGPSVAASERMGPRSCKDEGKVPACPATPPGAPSRGPGKAAWTSH